MGTQVQVTNAPGRILPHIKPLPALSQFSKKTKNSGKNIATTHPLMNTFNISKRLKTGTKQLKNLKGSEQLEFV